jgi:hypothetical protein
MGRHAVGSRPKIVVAMDWTDFDADNEATIMLSLVSRHGRSTPLVWLTVDKATLKNHRNAYEYRVLVQLAEALPADVKVLIVADRGFDSRSPSRPRRSAPSRRRCRATDSHGALPFKDRPQTKPPFARSRRLKHV